MQKNFNFIFQYMQLLAQVYYSIMGIGSSTSMHLTSFMQYIVQ